jgi:poly(A) polymerase
MLRAARFAAKLGFELDAGTAEPIPQLAGLLENIPPARLFDEFGKMFQAGYALATWQRLQRFGLLTQLFPWTAKWLEAAPDQRRAEFIETALANTDKRVMQDLPVTPMFMFAVLLWGPVRERADALMEREQMSEPQALIAAANDIAIAQNGRIAVPKRFSFPMREILQMQPRFARRQPKRAQSLLEHRRFRAAYDLMLLRVTLGEVDQDTADFWTAIQKDHPQPERSEEPRDPTRAKKRPARRRRKA